jgi:hypothetical protein
MTYVQMQNAVLADAFSESKRVDAKTWIQARHAWLWDAEQWEFRKAKTAITFTANQQQVASPPSDFRHAIRLYDANGYRLRDLTPGQFLDCYAVVTSGSPEAFTVLNNQILVGPSGDGTAGTLLYEKAKPTLSADSDTTGLPDAYDLALVHGAKAEGFKLANIPLWQGFDEDFTAYYNAMKRDYLAGIRSGSRQLGRQWR